MEFAIGREIGMEHDLLLRRKDGSVRHFRIYGRSTPNAGDTITLPIDGRPIKARVGELHGVASSSANGTGPFDHVDAAEVEGS